jgi:hypothetical protein
MYRVASASVSSATAALASKVPAVPMLTSELNAEIVNNIGILIVLYNSIRK